MTGRLQGLAERSDDLLLSGEISNVLQVLFQRLASHSHLATVKETFLEQEFEERRCATNVVDIGHDVLAGWLQVCQ